MRVSSKTAIFGLSQCRADTVAVVSRRLLHTLALGIRSPKQLRPKSDIGAMTTA